MMNTLTRRDFMKGMGAAALLAAGLDRGGFAAEGKKPNIIWIMADDLGYGDLGCYGQKQIKTPALDRMAAEGVRFTDFYAGSTVCAPSRCALMTGYDTGHTWVRGNALQSLRPGDLTVAELLKRAGYATGLIGKWGLGEAGTEGIPTKKGFDYFFGYLNQRHAHNYYPDFLWRNEEKVQLGNVLSEGEPLVSKVKKTWSHDLFAQEALAFVEKHQREPFFLYLSPTLPHANNEAGRVEGNGMEIPSDAPYANEPWKQTEKNRAAMITRLDKDIGALLAKLKELGLDENTIVFFTSDNGPHKEGGSDPALLGESGPLRGIKRDLYEGGIRVPMIVRWPGRIKPGRVSGQPWAFWDFLPTAAELAGQAEAVPAGIQGISMLPEILGRPQPKPHEYLYWEFYEGGFKQAARVGNWKAVGFGVDGRVELYDLAKDLGETKDVAAEHPDVVAKMKEIFKRAHVDNEKWNLAHANNPPTEPAAAGAKGGKKKKGQGGKRGKGNAAKKKTVA